jgi:hypothetical protein
MYMHICTYLYMSVFLPLSHANSEEHAAVEDKKIESSRA